MVQKDLAVVKEEIKKVKWEVRVSCAVRPAPVLVLGSLASLRGLQRWPHDIMIFFVQGRSSSRVGLLTTRGVVFKELVSMKLCVSSWTCRGWYRLNFTSTLTGTKPGKCKGLGRPKRTSLSEGTLSLPPQRREIVRDVTEKRYCIGLD